MNDFEGWFLEVIGIVSEKMSINLSLMDAHLFVDSYSDGLSPMDAVKKHYGL